MPQDDDKDIDTSEVPELDDAFFKEATLTRPGEDLIQEDFEVPPIALRTPDLDFDEGSNEEEVTGEIPSDIFAAAAAPEDEPQTSGFSATINIPEDGSMPSFTPNGATAHAGPPMGGVAGGAPAPVIDINKAAQFALVEACRAASQYGYKAMVIVYDDYGAYQFRCGNLNVTSAIGFLHRVCLGLHNAAAEQIAPQSSTYVGPKPSEEQN